MNLLKRIVLCTWGGAVIWCICLLISVPKRALSGREATPDEDERYHEIRVRLKGPLTAVDPLLLQAIGQHFLIPPSDEPYNFRIQKSPNIYLSSVFIASVMGDLFRGTRGGFFLEAGAMDGEFTSHSLYLERELGWRGLLVEPDEHNFAALKEKQRKAWISPTCLSTHGYPEIVVLKRDTEQFFDVKYLHLATGKIMKTSDLDNPQDLYNSLFTAGQCVPVESLLAALNVTHVDFFVLDVEQVELQVLENFPFQKISVDVWAIEHAGSGEDTEFVQSMVDRGYYYFDMLCTHVADYIFVRKGSEIFSKLGVPFDQVNRTDICSRKPFQIVTANTTSIDFSLEALRDPFHYPDLKYNIKDTMYTHGKV